MPSVNLVDKDLNNIGLLQLYFTKSKTFFCTFHVLKYFKHQCNQLIPKANKRIVNDALRSMVYAKDYENFLKYYEKLKANANQEFMSHFNDNWFDPENKTDKNDFNDWAVFVRNDIYCLNTMTNNHIERFNKEIKKVLSKSDHLSDCVRLLMKFTYDLRDRNNIHSSP